MKNIIEYLLSDKLSDISKVSKDDIQFFKLAGPNTKGELDIIVIDR